MEKGSMSMGREYISRREVAPNRSSERIKYGIKYESRFRNIEFNKLRELLIYIIDNC